jgi:hypothetical protein
MSTSRTLWSPCLVLFAALATPALADEAPLLELTPNGVLLLDAAGTSVSLAGDVAVLGVPGHDVGGAADQGLASVFHWDGASWTEAVQLFAPDGDAGDRFGIAVSVSPAADRLVVGADEAGVGGAAYVYRRVGATWVHEQTLTPDAATAGDDFGGAVAMDGDAVLVGSTGYDKPAQAERGAAYVFRQEHGGAWGQEQLLLAADGGAADLYGSAVALDGDTALVGAFNDNFFGLGFRYGAAYVLTFDGATWTQQKRLGPNDLSLGARFGDAVALHDGVAIVGAPEDEVAGHDDHGSVYVFDEDGGTWSQSQLLAGSDTAADDHFGRAVSLRGDVLVVGADGVQGLSVNEGAAYAFRFDGDAWVESDVLSDALVEAGDRLGAAVAVDGELVLVGAPGADGTGGANEGSAHVFDLLPAAWSWAGHGLAGADAAPVLSPSGDLSAGSPVSLTLSEAAPSAALFVVLGASVLNAPIKGGVLVPSPDLLVEGLVTSPQGSVELTGTWPAAVPSGLSVVAQVWVVDGSGPKGVTASHGVVGTTP